MNRSSRSRSSSSSRDRRPRAGSRRGPCAAPSIGRKRSRCTRKKAEQNHHHTTPARASRDASGHAPALGHLLVVEADPLVALVLHPGHVVPAVRVLALVRQDRNQLVPAPAGTNNERRQASSRLSAGNREERGRRHSLSVQPRANDETSTSSETNSPCCPLTVNAIKHQERRHGPGCLARARFVLRHLRVGGLAELLHPRILRLQRLLLLPLRLRAVRQLQVHRAAALRICRRRVA